MTERLADVSHRQASVGQLAEVVGAMRALAAARVREAHERLESARAYAQNIAFAIRRTLPLAPPPERSSRMSKGALAVLAFGAEQGFAGGFNARIFDAVEALAARPAGRPVQLFLIGSRALVAAEARGLKPKWSCPLFAHLDGAPALVEAITTRLFEGLAAGEIGAILAIHAAPGAAAESKPVERALAPFDATRFPRLEATAPPLTTLTPAVLIERLAEEYIFAEIVEAAVLSFAAENEARLRAMTSARRHIDELKEQLNGLARTMRQDEITNEIVELAADADALAVGSRAGSP